MRSITLDTALSAAPSLGAPTEQRMDREATISDDDPIRSHEPLEELGKLTISNEPTNDFDESVFFGPAASRISAASSKP